LLRPRQRTGGNALSSAEPNIQAVWLMAAVDDLLLPWQVDLVLRHELPAELEDHLQRVGQCLWSSPAQTPDCCR
jgi:hypothetical protein